MNNVNILLYYYYLNKNPKKFFKFIWTKIKDLQ